MLNLKKIDRIAGGSGRPKAYGFLIYMAKRKPENSRKYHLKYKESFPEKLRARKAAQERKCEDGMCRHHWSYNKIHQTDFIPVPKNMHREIHKHITYDQSEMMYRRNDTGDLLVTKRLHVEFINKIINQ